MNGRAMALRVEGLEHSYEGRTVLEVPEFEVPAGQTCALLGPSGSGKSTLLRVLALLERPSEGTVLVGGAVAGVKDRSVRKTMAAVFQEPYLFNGTVADNVAYGLRLRRIPRGERNARVVAALGRVGLEGFGKRSALRLSGGEAQRVSLARALVLEPRILFLDEPLSSLDSSLKRKMAREFASILADAGVTTVYVTHDQDEALTVAHRIAIMRAGHIVRLGSADAVMSMPEDEWVAGFVGMEPPVKGVVESCTDGLCTVRCGSVRVFVTADAPVGTSVSLGIRPEDVTLFEPGEHFPVSSLRNRLDLRVAEVVPTGSTTRVVLADDGFRIASRVSRAAVEDMSLTPGLRVVAAFKATAVRVAVGG